MRTFKINTVAVIVSPSWRINDKINSRSTISFAVTDKATLTGINDGDEALVEDGATKIFAGTIEKVDEIENDPGFVDYQITAVDFCSLADKRVTADTASNELAGDIITNKILPILAEEGVIAGTIENGPTIKKAVFNYVDCSTALNYIRDVSGMNWNIDFDKQLNFFERASNTAPYALDDTVQHTNFKVSKNRGQYRNKQYIRAGKGTTTTQTLEKPSPKPDGVTRNFIVRFPVAEKPRIYIGSVEVNASDIGVNGLDQNKKWYFSYASNVITQDSSETVLADTDVPEITYVGLYPILTVADNPVEIGSRKIRETGTSGIYERLTKEPSINERDQALEFAQGMLVKYGIVPRVVTFTTQVAGLKAGQLLPVNKPLFGINASYLIESVDTYTPDGVDTAYSVKCLDGSSLGGWEEFFRDLIKGNREYVIQENEILVLLNLQTESHGHEGETTVSVFQCLYPAEDLFPSETLYPGTLTSEVTLDD